MEEQVYNTAKLHAALQVLDRRGIEASVVFKNTGIDRALIHDDQIKVSNMQILEFFRNISEQFWDPYLPYEIGENLHVSAYGLYGYAVLCSVNYRETAEFAQKFHFLAAPTSTLNFNAQKGDEGWDFEPKTTALADPDFYAFLVNLQLGIFNSLHRDVMGAEFQSPLIEVKYSSAAKYNLPSDATTAISYGAPRNRFHVSRKWFDHKLELGNHLTFKQVVRICETELSELTQQDGLAGQVRKTLIQNVAFASNMDAVAAQLGLTSRTLRRHLKREGTTFSAIVDKVRTELALKYLREASLSTEDIAHILGFSETTSFLRAFRRWTGHTPKFYRISQ